MDKLRRALAAIRAHKGYSAVASIGLLGALGFGLNFISQVQTGVGLMQMIFGEHWFTAFMASWWFKLTCLCVTVACLLRIGTLSVRAEAKQAALNRSAIERNTEDRRQIVAEVRAEIGAALRAMEEHSTRTHRNSVAAAAVVEHGFRLVVAEPRLRDARAKVAEFVAQAEAARGNAEAEAEVAGLAAQAREAILHTYEALPRSEQFMGGGRDIDLNLAKLPPILGALEDQIRYLRGAYQNAIDELKGRNSDEQRMLRPPARRTGEG